MPMQRRRLAKNISSKIFLIWFELPGPIIPFGFAQIRYCACYAQNDFHPDNSSPDFPGNPAIGGCCRAYARLGTITMHTHSQDALIIGGGHNAPGFRKRILGQMALSPFDLERKFGLVGCDIFHGRMSLDQLWAARPVIGAASYKGPLKRSCGNAACWVSGSVDATTGGLKQLPIAPKS